MFARNKTVLSLAAILALTLSVSVAHAEGEMKKGKVFKAKEKAKEEVLPQGYVKQGGLTWMPVSSTVYFHSEATVLCAGTINGQTGWRLPTQDELFALYSSGAMKGQGWSLSSTWSSTPNSTGGHNGVYLDDDSGVNSTRDTYGHRVSCVR